MKPDVALLKALEQVSHLDIRTHTSNGRCVKLTDEEVTEIRALAASGILSRKRIAELYHVHTSTVSDLVTRKTRKAI